MTESTLPVAMISGAGRGIGAAIAEELSQNGWAISLGCRHPSQVPDRPGSQQLVCHYDALDDHSDQQWIDKTIERFGRIDAVIHNAGIMLPRSVIDATDEEFDLQFAVNVKAPMRLTKRLWPWLKISGRGRIITLASLSAKRVKSTTSGLYAMSKYAVLAMNHALRKEGESVGIRACAFCPSFVATDMGTALTEIPATKMTQPEDIAILVRTVLMLPNSATISEIPINWTVEDNY